MSETPGEKCRKCGLCCMGHLILEASELDVMREPRIAAAGAECKDGGEYGLSDLCWSLNTGADLGAGLPACPFAVINTLGGDATCMIYRTRPNMCVAFEPGGEQCQELRLGVGLSQALKTAEAKHQRGRCAAD